MMIPLGSRQNMWFMRDGAPPYFTLNIRNHLNENFQNRRIGREKDAPANWQPRSPDLMPMDYFLWGTLKEIAYSRLVN